MSVHDIQPAVAMMVRYRTLGTGDEIAAVITEVHTLDATLVELTVFAPRAMPSMYRRIKFQPSRGDCGFGECYPVQA